MNFLQKIKDLFKPSQKSIEEKHPLDGPIRAAEEKQLKLFDQPVQSNNTPLSVQPVTPEPVVPDIIKEPDTRAVKQSKPRSKKPLTQEQIPAKSNAIANPKKPKARK